MFRPTGQVTGNEEGGGQSRRTWAGLPSSQSHTFRLDQRMNLQPPEDNGHPCLSSDTSDIIDVDDLSDLGTTELINHVRALQAEKSRLQVLVCDLLTQNEQLRLHNDHFELSDHPRARHA